MNDFLTIEKLLQFRERNVHIVGIAGTEGFAVMEFLLKLGFSRLTGHNMAGGDALQEAFFNAHVALPPKERTAAFNRLLAAPLRLCTGPAYLENIRSADLIFPTQNWFAHAANDPLKQARDSGIPFRFLTQLYLSLSPAPVAAVTGTNGKTTVTTCLTHLLKTAGIPCLMSGNDRYHPQAICELDTLPPHGALVLEISNRQLLELRNGPQIAVLTNIRPDHIDEHGSFESYCRIKASLFKMVPASGWSILNAEDPYSAQIAAEVQSGVIMYGLNKPAGAGDAGLIDHQFCRLDRKNRLLSLFDVQDPRIPGRHNLLNCLAAAVAASVLGASFEAIREGIRTFSGVKHRVEFLAEVDGIGFFDDEASTNPEATRAAIDALNRPVVLICGGDCKGNDSDYDVLKPVLQHSVRAIIRLPGDAGVRVQAAAGSIPVHEARDLKLAMSLADSLLVSGDALLMSPAGAGFHSRFNAGSHGFRRLVRDRVRRARTAGSNPDHDEETS